MTANRYQIGEMIGRGSSADVFRSELSDITGPWRHVAVKRLHDPLAENSPDARRLTREAHLASRLEHPNVVSIVDVTRDANDRVLLVMELVDGPSLARLLDAGPLPLPVAIYIVRQVLRALAHAHAQSIHHRDVSPNNVLLSRTGEVKLGDFGYAKAATEKSRAPDRYAGTAAYIAPETIIGLRPDHRGDLYAVGTMLYQLVTGELPFGHGSVAEYWARMVTDTPLPPSDLCPDLPGELDAVVLKLMAREREDRYQSAEEVLEALADFLASGPEALAEIIHEQGEDAWKPKLPLPLPPDGASAAPGKRDKRDKFGARRSRYAMPLILTLAGALLGGAAVAWLQSPDAPHEQGPTAPAPASETPSRDKPAADKPAHDPDQPEPAGRDDEPAALSPEAVANRSDSETGVDKASHRPRRSEWTPVETVRIPGPPGQ